MLSTSLYSGEVSPEFFRVLSGANSRVYIDVLDALEREMGEGTLGLSRQEAVEIAQTVVEHHAGLRMEEEENPAHEDLESPRGQSNFLLNRLIASGWLSEPQRPDYQRIIYFERQGEIMLDALRRIATPETVQFTDKLQLVCATLVNPESFTENPLSDLEACIANAHLGLQELRGMQKSVERMTRRQLEAQTLRQNLSVLYDDFSETIGHSCYRELVRVRLPIRLKQARKRLEEIEMDIAILERMQSELLRRQLVDDPTQAMSKVRLRLNELLQALDAIEPQAEMMDRRAAEFARRSFARFRYLQEIGGARREQVQAVFEFINKKFAGTRLSDIDAEINLPDMLLGEGRVIGGLESLFAPRTRRSVAENTQIDPEPDEADREACLLEMESNLRNSLTVLRANQFIKSIDFGASGSISSSEIPIRTEDDIADLAAVLLHSESSDARFRIKSQRESGEVEDVDADSKAGFRIERFEIEKR